MARRRHRKAEGLPALLVRLIESAKLAGEDASGADISGAPDALRALGVLAQRALPIHGVFVCNNNEMSLAIQKISMSSLGLNRARREFREAIKSVEPFARRDEIESAANAVRRVDDETYFYAGLAFGITLARLEGAS